MRILLVSLIVLAAVFSVYPNASAEVTLYGPMGSVMERFLSPKIERISPVISKKTSEDFPEFASEATATAASSGEMKETINHLNAVRYMMSCA